ncbi:MAG: 16S rRNA processing protein RimM [Firmicutes bacterium]|nr:16S rRNA processing protein RimM [Bacillota bacterium]
MDLIYIGKIVNTHGLKGEIRIISDFKYKDDVFKINNIVYINNNKYIIKSYRHHKIYDMITLDSINSIEQAENLKGLSIYINREDYKFDGYLNEDLIGLNVYDNDIYKGKVVDILKTSINDLIVIDGIKRHMVPNIPEFVKEVDLENKKIYIEYIRGLDNED